eukprot:8155250-Pyramimonas_sp.AAC.1
MPIVAIPIVAMCDSLWFGVHLRRRGAFVARPSGCPSSQGHASGAHEFHVYQRLQSVPVFCLVGQPGG